jgi:hypothetical protein
MYCSRCESIVAPADEHSVVARVLRLPLSLRRDERWQRLLEIYNRHMQAVRDIARLQDRHGHLVVRLAHWRDAFGSNRPHDYDGADNWLFGALDHGVKRYLNSISGFRRASQHMLSEHRAALLAGLDRLLPQSVDAFVAKTREAIERAQPHPMIYPTEQAKCSMCTEATVDVRLHKQHVSADEVPCRCIQFLVCLDCLLRWYWESSEQLHKSFSTCPTCRTLFRLEDIVRVHWPFDHSKAADNIDGKESEIVATAVAAAEQSDVEPSSSIAQVNP